jgi:hypothetical protein
MWQSETYFLKGRNVYLEIDMMPIANSSEGCPRTQITNVRKRSRADW